MKAFIPAGPALTMLALTLLAAHPAAATQTFSDVTINAADNIYGAGQTSAPGGGNVPTGYTITPGTGEILTFSSVTGTITLNNGNYNDPDGFGSVSSSANTGANGISGIGDSNYAGYLVGVFTTAGVPSGSSPTGLNFSLNGDPGTIATNFTSLSPQLDQTFYIGDGLTGDGTGTTQQFIVPTGATALYLGISDAGGYNGSPGAYGDNFGNYTASFQISGNTSPAPEPSQIGMLALMVSGLLGLIVRARKRQMA